MAGIAENRRERGAALIIVLGLVALISSWAVTAAYEDMLSLRRAENSQNAVRAAQASQSALALAAKVLRDDARDGSGDDLDEAWAQETPSFAIDDGSVIGRIIDANRFINLNTLIDRQGKAVPAVEQQVKRLFASLELAPALVDALIDWVDADDRRHGAGGAEDAAYYSRDYRVANAPLNRWRELYLVRGFDRKIVAKLAKVAIARPTPASGITPVNLNTASAPVLMALMPEMTAADAEAFIAERPFASVDDALQNRIWAANVNRAYLSVASDAFMVRTEARFGRVVLREKFMLQRDSAGKITLLSAGRAEALAPLAADAGALP